MSVDTAAELRPFRDAALETVFKHERPAFPCDARKAPLTPNGFKAATFDPTTLDYWSRENPDALVGVPTGAASGFDVLDIDPRNGGDQWLLANEHRLPATRIVATRSGGRHIFFKAQPGLRCSAGAIAPGVDIRADGGYVIGWQAHGLPVLDTADPAPWPAWLVMELTKCQSSTRTTDRTLDDLGTPPSWQAVVTLLDRMPNPLHVGRDEYVSVLLGARGCIQALEAAGMECDAAAIGDAAARWAERWEGYAGTDERAKWESDFALRDAPLSGWRHLEQHARRLIPSYAAEQAEAEFASAPLPAEDPATHDNRGRARKLRRERFDDIRPVLTGNGSLIKGLLDAGTMSVVYGASNVGKSFFALDLAYHVATGAPWRGRLVKRRGCVVYVAAEGGAGFRNRVAALKQRLGVGHGVPLEIIPCPVDMSRDGADVPELLDHIRAAAEETGLPVAMVVIDTLSRAMAGTDENAPADMTAFVRNVDRLRAAAPGPHVMVIHHSGKDAAKGSRGHSSLRAATDTEIELVRKGEGADKSAVASVRKQRDLAGEDVFPFTLAIVDLGRDEDGDPVTSAAVEHLTDLPGAAKAESLPASATAALGVLRAMLGDEADNGAVVRLSAWREACANDARVSGADNPQSRERVIRRALEILSRAGRVRADKENIGLPWASGAGSDGLATLVSGGADSGQDRTSPQLSAVRKSEKADRTGQRPLGLSVVRSLAPALVRSVKPMAKQAEPVPAPAEFQSVPGTGDTATNRRHVAMSPAGQAPNTATDGDTTLGGVAMSPRETPISSRSRVGVAKPLKPVPALPGNAAAKQVKPAADPAPAVADPTAPTPDPAPARRVTRAEMRHREKLAARPSRPSPRVANPRPSPAGEPAPADPMRDPVALYAAVLAGTEPARRGGSSRITTPD